MASQVPPKKGVAFSLGVNLYTNTGGLITAPSSVTANTAKDFSTAYEAASSVAVASTNYGLIKVVLDSTQMNGDVIAVEVEDDTANSVPFTAIIYTSANLLDEISTAIYGESTKLSTLITAESTKLSTAIYSESTKLSTLIKAVSSLVSSGVTVAGFSDAACGRLGIVAYGTAQAADSTSITLASSHAFGTDELNGAIVYITGDTGVGQARTIVDYAADKASVDAWTTTPAAAATYVVFAVPPASALMLPQVNVTQLSGDSTAADNAELFFDGTGYAGGTEPLVVKVGSIDTNALSAEAVSAGAVSKISSGLATSTAVSTSFAALSTKMDALSTTVQAESTRLSTAIYYVSSQVSSVVASTGGGASAADVALAVWASAVPSTFSTGTAGYVLGTYLDTSVAGIGTVVRAESTKLSTAIYGESTKLSTRIQALSALTSSGFSSVVSTLGGMGTAILAESTKLSTRIQALSALTSSGFSSVYSTVGGLGTALLAESTKLSTKVDALNALVDAESTKLSTAIYGEAAKLSTGISGLSSNLDTVASALSSVASTPSTEVAAAVWDMELASTYSGQSLVRGMASVLLGKVSGSSGSTTVFRDVADGKNVVTAITDAEGNRTAVTLDLSS